MSQESYRQEHLNRRTKGRESKAEKLKVDTMKTMNQVPVFKELLPQIGVMGQGRRLESSHNREIQVSRWKAMLRRKEMKSKSSNEL